MSTFSDVILLDGARVPGLAYGVGTAHFGKTGDGGVNRELVEHIKTALKVGYKHLDTAEAYSNEASVGAALAETDVPREDIYLTGKVAAGLKDGKWKETVESQLKKLQTSYFDLYLIHWPYDLGKDGFPSIEEAWSQLEQIKDAGLAKSIGVSNFRKAELAKIVEGKATKHLPTVNQIEFHPYCYELAQTPLAVDYCREKGIHIAAYGPTTPLTALAGGPLDAALAEVTKSVSARAGDSVEPGQVLLKLAQQEGAIVVTTSAKESRMKEQLAAGAIPELNDEELESLKAAGNKKQDRRFMKHFNEEPKL